MFTNKLRKIALLLMAAVVPLIASSQNGPPATVFGPAPIIALWKSCTGTNYLRSDGFCGSPSAGLSSIGLSMPSLFSVANSPLTSNGTLAVTFATGQLQNRVLASPDGSSGAVSLRALVAADLPSISLTSGVTGILPGANGGTNNGFMAFSGPATSLKTFTLPNASSTILTTNAAVTVAQGGTGAATLTGLLLGNGTSPFSAATSANVISLWTGTCNSGTFLRADGSCQAPSAGSPGGSDTQVQYNNAGSFGGSASFTWNNTTNTLTVGSAATAPIIRSANNPSGAGKNLTITTGVDAGASGATGSLNLRTADGNASGVNSGNIFLQPGDVTGNTQGGATTILAGNGVGAGAGGALTLRAGTGGASALAGALTLASGNNGGGGLAGLTLATGSTTRLTIQGDGSWDIDGTTPGTAGQVFTSNGASSAPSWQAAGTTAPGGSNTQIQFNGSSAFAGDADLTWNSASNVLSILGGGSQLIMGAVSSSTNITTVNGSGGSAGGDLLIVSGYGGNSSGTGGKLTLQGGMAQGGSGTPGELNIEGAPTTLGGPAGFVQIKTAATTRVKFDADGSWDMAGSTPGTNGQVLTSSGSGSAPSWQTPAAPTLPTTTRYKAATTTRTNDATATADPDLAYASLAAGTYALQGYVQFTAGGTGGIKASILASQAIASSRYSFQRMQNGTTAVNAVLAAAAPTTTASATRIDDASSNDGMFEISATLILPSTTTISLQWAQNTSDGTGTAVLAGSWLMLTKLSP